MKRLLAIIGLAAGLGLGLLYTWVLNPVKYTDTDPVSLRADYKASWMQMAAQAYQVDGDAARARDRIAVLGEANPAQAVTALAQRLAAAGGDAAAIQALAGLAAALGAGPAASPPPMPSPTETPAPTATLAPTLTPTPTLTPQLLPTPLPSPTAPGAFVFAGQEVACAGQPLLQVVALDAQGMGVPGVQVIVEWAGGQDQFFTGLKPELGAGYGDFAMQSRVDYTVHLTSNPAAEQTVRSEPCTDANGQPASSSVRLSFKQPQP